MNREKNVLRNYFIRRFFRIAPLFYIAIFYYLWQKGFWHGNPNHYSFQHIFSVFSFTNGFSPEWINGIVFGGWSIAVEVIFYLVFPLLFRYLKSIPVTLFVTLFVAIAVQIGRLFLLSLPFSQTNGDVQTFLFQFFPSQLPVFLIGITTFRLMTTKIFSRSDVLALRIFVIVISLILLTQFIFQIKIIAGHYLYAVIFSSLLFFLSKYSVKIIVNSALSTLGKISFSVYLSHFAVLYWLNELGLIDFYLENSFTNYSLRFFVVLVLSSAISMVTYNLVEQKGQFLGKQIISR